MFFNPLAANTINYESVSLHNVLRSCPFDLAMAIAYFVIYEEGDNEEVSADDIFFYCDAARESISKGESKHYEKWYRSHFFVLQDFLCDFLLYENYGRNITDFIEIIEKSTDAARNKRQIQESENES